MSRTLMGLLIMSIAGVSTSSICQAKDFGKLGATFAIKEEGFLAMIKRKLVSLDIAAEQEKMTTLAKERVNAPAPVEGLTKAEKTREFYFDPSYVLTEDIVLPCGKVLYKAGVRVNPLDHMDFQRRLFFIDGRDDAQVSWLKEQLDLIRKQDEVATPQNNSKSSIVDRIILTGGKILELQEQLGHELYFDQSGELVTKFGIKSVPAVVIQEGKGIKIKEVKLDE